MKFSEKVWVAGQRPKSRREHSNPPPSTSLLSRSGLLYPPSPTYPLTFSQGSYPPPNSFLLDTIFSSFCLCFCLLSMFTFFFTDSVSGCFYKEEDPPLLLPLSLLSPRFSHCKRVNTCY